MNRSQASPAAPRLPFAPGPQELARGGERSKDAVLLTSGEYKAHLNELARLRDFRNRELPARLREARSFVSADAAEEIAHIQDEQVATNARIVWLDDLLRCAQIVAEEASPGVVSVGQAVEVEYLSSGRVVTYHLEGAGMSTAAGSVSARSPVGRALIGRGVGDTVAVELPSGRLEALRIVSIERADASDLSPSEKGVTQRVAAA